MYGAIVTASDTADLDVFFLHNDGYSTMCGHAIIALSKLAIEAGGKDELRQLRINVPAGTVYARARPEGGRVREVYFRNVPSFVYLYQQCIHVDGIGRVRFDVAYGGAFYAVTEAAPLGLALVANQYSRLIDYGRRIKRAIADQYPITHPIEGELSFLYGTIFTGPAMDPRYHSRNVTVFANGEVDRSATGSGVSARAALLYQKRELRMGEKITVESILGSTMTVSCVQESQVGTFDAVVPEVAGTAHVIGRCEFYFDPDDVLNQGFILR